MTDQTPLPDELRSAPPQPTILNSTSMTMNAATVPLTPKPTPVYKGYVRIGCYDGRKFVIVLPQDICEDLGIDIHTRLDYVHDADNGSIWVEFDTIGHLGVQHYRASCGGYQFTVRATDGSDYEEVKLRYNFVPVMYDCDDRTLDIDARGQLQKLAETPLDSPPNKPEAEEMAMVTKPLNAAEAMLELYDAQEAAEYLMAAQARLLQEFGDRLSYVLDDNGHISNIDVSLV